MRQVHDQFHKSASSCLIASSMCRCGKIFKIIIILKIAEKLSANKHCQQDSLLYMHMHSSFSEKLGKSVKSSCIIYSRVIGPAQVIYSSKASRQHIKMADYKLGEVEEEGENGFELMIDLRRREPGNQCALCLAAKKDAWSREIYRLVFAVMSIFDVFG